MGNYPKLKTYRESNKLTLEELSERVGISVSQLHRFETGSREPRVSEMQDLAVLYKTTLADISGEVEMNRIPLVSWVSAGRLSRNDPVQNVDIESFIPVPDLKPSDYIGLRVEGDSMDRVAPPGSIIIVDRRDTEPREDRFYVFAYDDERGSTFKRFRGGDPPKLQPYSTNPDQETIYARGRLAVIGRVRRVVTDV